MGELILHISSPEIFQICCCCKVQSLGILRATYELPGKRYEDCLVLRNIVIFAVISKMWRNYLQLLRVKFTNAFAFQITGRNKREWGIVYYSICRLEQHCKGNSVKILKKLKMMKYYTDCLA